MIQTTDGTTSGMASSISITVTPSRWKFCAQCGAKLEDVWIHCPQCGTLIGTVGAAPITFPYYPAPQPIIYPIAPSYPQPWPFGVPYITTCGQTYGGTPPGVATCSSVM